MDPDGGDVLDKIQMMDISRSGLGAFSRRPFYPGQRIVLSLPISPEGRRRNVHATICRCRAIQDGYRIGLEFDGYKAGASMESHLPAAA